MGDNERTCSSNDNVEVYLSENESELEINEAVEHSQKMQEDITLFRPIKRGRGDDDEEDWTEVKRKDKKSKEDKSSIQIYLSSKDKMPKQFALAKILNDNNITGITQVKYIGLYKVRLTFENEADAMNLEKCEAIITLGWRIQSAMEKYTTHGVIRDIELEISEEEILKNVTCPDPIKLISVKRLMRRTENGWSLSESVRLCFLGSFLPTYIIVDSLKIKVVPYVFPVSQCSNCWKFGHTAKFCSTNKVFCPKCGGNHQNCEAKTFKCINCAGRHMALERSCPAWLKEKKLRDLMSEYNCTYRKALDIYVPPSPPIPTQEQVIYSQHISKPSTSSEVRNEICAVQEHDLPQDTKKHTYASVAKTKPRSSKRPGRIVRSPTPHSYLNENNDVSEPSPSREDQSNIKINSFKELLNRLKEIMFLKSGNIQSKIYNAIKCCLEWVILVAVESISDWPVLKIIFDYFNGQYK